MKDPKYGELFYYLGLVTQVGFTVVFSILIFLIIGIFLDKRLGTGGILVVAFILIGVIAGFYNAYKLIARKEKSEK